MSKPGNFSDLLELLDAVPTPPTDSPRRAPRPPPAIQLHQIAEQQWIVSGILRLAFTLDDDGKGLRPSPSTR